MNAFYFIPILIPALVGFAAYLTYRLTKEHSGKRELQDIVAGWLELYGYDGLYDPGCCACKLDDLMPCGEPTLNCTAGYLTGKGNCDADFHISHSKKDVCQGDGACGL